VKVYSDRISGVSTSVYSDYYYVGEANTSIVVIDKFNNTLTDQFVNENNMETQTFIVNYTWSNYGSNPIPEFETNYTDEWNRVDLNYGVVGDISTYIITTHSKYQITSYPKQRGNYNVLTFICFMDSIFCTADSEYIMTDVSPQNIYLHPETPNADTSTAVGEGTIRQFVSKPVDFTVYIRDRYNNSFDSYNDKLHNGVTRINNGLSIDAFLITKLTIYDSKYVSKEIDVVSEWTDYFNGVYNYIYTVPIPNDGLTLLEIKVLNT